MDNTDLDHIVDGESCPHRSSGGQSIGQGQMSETYRTNDGSSQKWFCIIIYQSKELQHFSFISAFTCFTAWILEPASRETKSIFSLLLHCTTEEELWRFKTIYYISIVYLAKIHLVSIMAWPSDTYTIFHETFIRT